MEAEQQTVAPIIDQILELLFSQLSTHEEFDPATIEAFNRLAQRHELSKPALVINALVANPGGHHETH